MGTTMRRGSRPIVLTLTTKAGRIFWISAPTAGSKSTIQISPRLGAGTVAMKVVLAKSFKGSQRGIVSVVCFREGGGLNQNRVALIRRQFSQFGCGPPSLRRGGK